MFVFRKIRYLLASVLLLIISASTGCEYISSITDVSPSPSSIAESTTTAASTTTTEQFVFPEKPVYTPEAGTFKPSEEESEIYQYMLDLINEDRQNAGLSPVTMGSNAAALSHAQDMFDNYFVAHWGTNGLKPYIRYTISGGLNYEMENSAYTGWYDPAEDESKYGDLDIKQALYDLQYAMMNDDGPTWGHRNNIINKYHDKVNMGIVYDDKRLALVQQFEGNFIEYFEPPSISGSTLTIGGSILEGKLKSVNICFDELPVPLTPDELLNGPYHSYSLGGRVGYVVSPPPPGQYYSSLSPEAVVADLWETNDRGQFMISADISETLAQGKGVYTIVIYADCGEETVQITNYSISIE